MTNLMIFEESKGLTAFECAQKCLESDYCAGIHLRYNYYCVFLKYENGGTWNEADFYHRSKLFISAFNRRNYFILFYFFALIHTDTFIGSTDLCITLIIIMKNNNIKLPTILMVHKAKYKFQSIATPRTSKKIEVHVWSCA